MRHLRFVVAWFVVIWSVGCSLAIGGQGSGGQAGAFLRIGVGGRAVGMGGAFTAIADEASATYWNPAGLGYLEKRQFSGMYSIASLDRTHSCVSYIQSIPPGGTVGITWINFGVGKIDGRDDRGEPTGYFDDSEMAFLVSYGRRLSTISSVGASAKYLMHSIANNKASGFGFDIGALLKISEVTSFGIVIQDIASGTKWDTASEHKDSYPIQVRVGWAVSLKIVPLIVATEVRKTNNQELESCAGIEYELLKVLAVRCGYGSSGFAAGLSARVPVSVMGVRVDYAGTGDKATAGWLHKISLNIDF